MDKNNDDENKLRDMNMKEMHIKTQSKIDDLQKKFNNAIITSMQSNFELHEMQNK